jgi:hypothetical protein
MPRYHEFVGKYTESVNTSTPLASLSHPLASGPGESEKERAGWGKYGIALTRCSMGWNPAPFNRDNFAHPPGQNNVNLTLVEDA